MPCSQSNSATMSLLWGWSFVVFAMMVASAGSSLVLSDHIMSLTKEAAKLSMLAYGETEPEDTVTHDYSAFGYNDAEHDQALTVETSDGHCFVAFRGSSLTIDDWSQNLTIGSQNVCVDVAGTTECCTVRAEFYDVYDTVYRKDMEDTLRKCASKCENKDDCTIITGYSQGGAIAAVAAVFLADLNPYVITFGQPPTLVAPCNLVTTERIFRYVNTMKTDLSIAYDPVTMTPGLDANHFEKMIVLGDDPTGVAFVGLDDQEFLQQNLNGIAAHYMTGNGTDPGYIDRIDALTAPNATYPIRSNGFMLGSTCSINAECESNECSKELFGGWKRCIGIDCNFDDDCETGRCDSGACLTKATSCMDCDHDSDCAGASTVCLNYKCSNEFGLMDNHCFCRTGKECDSGRCEGTFPYPMCQAKLADGGTCVKGSDCISGFCGWSYVCEKTTATERGYRAFTWFLIAVAEVAILYWLYRLFSGGGRDGYTEVFSNENEIMKRKAKVLFVILAIILIAIVVSLVTTRTFRFTLMPPQYSMNPNDTPLDVSILRSMNIPSTHTHSVPFFIELPWENRSDGHLYGILEFCSDGNETYAYGVQGNCVPGQPSPLIRMKPKHHYHLILVNNAHIDTNLHTHGLHVSGVGSVDDVTRNVEPGYCLKYDYFIMDDADVGTFWYHPHRHPLVTTEAFGGAYGMLIVDDIIENYYPTHLENFLKRNQVILQFSSMYNNVVSHIRHNRVNGYRKLNLILDQGTFYYFRIFSVVFAESVNWLEISPVDACTSQPVAYDGVYRSEIPHPTMSNKHMLSVSSRLDLAVRCNEDAELHFHQGGNLTDTSRMVQIRVVKSGSSRDTDELTTLQGPTIQLTAVLPSSPYWDTDKQTSWQPRRPYYMPDLNSPICRIEDSWNISMDDYYLNGTKGFSVNQVIWDPKKAIRKYDLGQLVEWKLQRTQTHPYHSHINRMFIAEPGGCGFGRFEQGQYFDTISAETDECKVRVQFFDFAGRIVIHCHRFGHEDKGMMSWIDILGGHGHGMLGDLQVDCQTVL
ncbi:lipase class 3 [Nitzschia inconspicua]|uniref:Lipase class 3 n=1 Tax=Nitzschia inconspicua TaxID=303405 RepID=A0A9K3KJJ6_9STRA|nr:lipase class 3 [Nitzschia inconspicua]